MPRSKGTRDNVAPGINATDVRGYYPAPRFAAALQNYLIYCWNMRYIWDIWVGDQQYSTELTFGMSRTRLCSSRAFLPAAMTVLKLHPLLIICLGPLDVTKPIEKQTWPTCWPPPRLFMSTDCFGIHSILHACPILLLRSSWRRHLENRWSTRTSCTKSVTQSRMDGLILVAMVLKIIIESCGDALLREDDELHCHMHYPPSYSTMPWLEVVLIWILDWHIDPRKIFKVIAWANMFSTPSNCKIL